MRLKEGSQQLRTEDLVLINSDTLHDFKTNGSFMGFTMHIGALHLWPPATSPNMTHHSCCISAKKGDMPSCASSCAR